jgi:DNA polymerase-3 subunit delta'
MGDGLPELAHTLAADLLCQQSAPDGAACGRCRACELLASGTHPDLFRLTPLEDKTQISVAQVRELIGDLSLHSQLLGARVGLISPADAMNAAAANALLKTLEEPPPGCFLLLLSERPARMPATIRSRCQRLVLPAPAMADAQHWLLTMGIAPADAAALLHASQGAAHDALRLVDNPEEAEVLKCLLPDLDACLLRRLPVSDLAERYRDLPPGVLWPMLYRWLAERIATSARHGRASALRAPLDALAELQANWRGQAMNLNRQILLEDWLTRLMLAAAA